MHRDQDLSILSAMASFTLDFGTGTMDLSTILGAWLADRVLGAERTLFVWEKHEDFVPVSDTPEFIWIERDERAIRDLVFLANGLIGELHRLTN